MHQAEITVGYYSASLKVLNIKQYSLKCYCKNTTSIYSCRETNNISQNNLGATSPRRRSKEALFICIYSVTLLHEVMLQNTGLNSKNNFLFIINSEQNMSPSEG